DVYGFDWNRLTIKILDQEKANNRSKEIGEYALAVALSHNSNLIPSDEDFKQLDNLKNTDIKKFKESIVKFFIINFYFYERILKIHGIGAAPKSDNPNY